MKRHAAEIFTSVIVSTVFSLYSTAIVGRLVGLDPSLTVSILPRCITVALALSIVSLFEGTKINAFSHWEPFYSIKIHVCGLIRFLIYFLCLISQGPMRH